MPIQGDAVRDFIFPIVLAKSESHDSVSLIEFLGTGFCIGSNGYALTAGHVLDISVPSNHAIIGMFVESTENKWRFFNANTVDIHPVEDVALLRLGGNHWKTSGIKVSFEPQYSSMKYHLFGYPKSNLLECTNNKYITCKASKRPDLIYSEGHIRRRVSWELLNIKGKSFFELSTPVGVGCSGSPVFHVRNNLWNVVGIYICDKIEYIKYEGYDKDLNWGIQTIEIPSQLSYAVRMESLKDWVPKTLNHTLEGIN
ncbi:MAG: hypothetical protein SCARUB_00400 [Candidatus Scalindua rubra]|uniref:Trypsin n=1 Tax=Candidatus Scalindua rubra TaxID=1872076 RepID=A0A1E3XFT2_9BACT|nr:MAG: hypothetical protein SCARUB_00400 [Candidatus Scalindua rubra]